MHSLSLEMDSHPSVYEKELKYLRELVMVPCRSFPAKVTNEASILFEIGQRNKPTT